MFRDVLLNSKTSVSLYMTKVLPKCAMNISTWFSVG